MRPDVDRFVKVAERGDYTGICLECGGEQSGVEPDAAEYECESCGACRVYGAEELVLMFA